MGLLWNRVERNEIKPGDHIYTYGALLAYSHHGIFVEGCKVAHFTQEHGASPNSMTSFSSYDNNMYSLLPSCPISDCGFKQPNSRAVLSCLDCFLCKGSLYRFEYGVTPSAFLAKLRGGTSTTALSDSPETVVHRAMYLLQNGFGEYNVLLNNCEDFALYCKTGLVESDKSELGRSGQAASLIGVPLAALLTSPLKFLLPGLAVATVSAGMYSFNRYANDIGVRPDMVKVEVEDLAVKHGWGTTSPEEEEEGDGGAKRTEDQVTVKLDGVAEDVQSKQGSVSSTRTRKKVQMQGVAVGRAVDLTTLDGYESLIDKLENMFDIKGELHHRNKWKVVYQDDEGDMMLVGDDPWPEFCKMVKKIYIYSSGEVKKMTPTHKLPQSSFDDQATSVSQIWSTNSIRVCLVLGI